MPSGNITYNYIKNKLVPDCLNGMQLSNQYNVCYSIWYASCNDTFIRIIADEWEINPLPLCEKSGKGTFNNNDILFVDRYKHVCSYEHSSEPYELWLWPLTNVTKISYRSYDNTTIWHAYRNGVKIEI